MSFDPTVTICGNLTGDPQLSFTTTGQPWVRFTVAHTPRKFDKQTQQWTDGDTLFLRCTAWRDLAEHVAESLLRGTRVIATGRLRQSNWTTPEGENRTAIELTVEEVGPSLRWATAQIKKTQRQQATPNPAAGDPWATTPAPTPTTPTAGATNPAAVAAGQPPEPPF